MEQIKFRECLLPLSVESLSLKLLCQNYRTIIVPARPQGDVHIVHHKHIYISLLPATCFGFCGKPL